jgi:hypothetical protein
MLFGVNAFSSTLLQMLGTTPNKIPRYRDCFLSKDGTEIIIYTRTGGGNREAYEVENESLRLIPGFKRDEDDDFDCTYASFFFEVPEHFKAQVTLIKDMGAITNPIERWKQLLEDLKNDKDASSPSVQRALEVGKDILSKIEAIRNRRP